jgi:hypothetical protein
MRNSYLVAAELLWTAAKRRGYLLRMADFDDDPKRKAFLKFEAQIRGIGRDDLHHQNLDVSASVATIYGAAPRASVFEPEIAQLPFCDHPLIHSIPEMRLAVLHLQNERNASTRRASELAPLVEQGTALLELMVTDVKGLILRKLLPADALGEYDSSNGYQALANNLGLVSNLAMRHWAAIEGRSGMTKDDVTRASTLNTDIVRVIGQRTNDESEAPAFALLRAQAFTLLVRAYEELRRAIGYLRYHHGDADDITPSLYAGRGGRPRQAEKVAANGSKPQIAEPQSPEPVQDLPPISKDGPFR